MRKAHLLTIGTEITSGEVINSNAAWISSRLENMGVRVLSHLTVRDQREELLAALASLRFNGDEGGLVILTGGLGPTSDDVTRAVVAEFAGLTLEFDEGVWRDLGEMYVKRGLPLREAHKHQCWFPAASARLKNPVGTALGFYLENSGCHYFALPGPPRELEGVWGLEVEPRLKDLIPPTSARWFRWTFFAVPESEVAEVVEKVIAGTGLEVGYRAQVPYVKVKLFADPTKDASVLKAMDEVLAYALVGHDDADLADQLLAKWPRKNLRVFDSVTESALGARLFQARRARIAAQLPSPEVEYMAAPTTAPDLAGPADGLKVEREGSGFRLTMAAGAKSWSEVKELPYKMPIDSERGRRSVSEWALWLALKALAGGP